MTRDPAWWAVILTVLGGAAAWAGVIVRVLWTFRGKWDETNATLATLAAQDKRLEDELRRHLDWHERFANPPRIGRR